MTNANSYVKKQESALSSFTLPCKNTKHNVKLAEKACEMRVDELNQEADIFNNEVIKSEVRYHCNLRCEVIAGLDNIRVNVYGATPKDMVMIGRYFTQLENANEKT